MELAQEFRKFDLSSPWETFPAFKGTISNINVYVSQLLKLCRFKKPFRVQVLLSRVLRLIPERNEELLSVLQSYN